MNEVISILSSMATKRVLTELANRFDAQTGHRTLLTAIGGVDAARRVRAGERFDLVVLAEDAIQKLSIEGLLVPASIRALARSPAACAVRTGGYRPSGLDENTLRAFLSPSRSVAVSTGPSGVKMRQLLQRWDAATPEQCVRTVVEAPPGVPVARLIAEGKAEIGFQQLSELKDEPGIDILGLVPETMIPITVFSIAVGINASNARMAWTVLDYLTSTAAHSVLEHCGMSAPI